MQGAVLANVAATSWRVTALLVAVTLAGCDRQLGAIGENGFLCEEVVAGEATCFTQYQLRGRVFDADNLTEIAGATVVLRDAHGAAVSRTVTTDVRGVYVLSAPVPRGAERVQYTITATANGYRSQPNARVVALAVRGSPSATIVESAVTDIGLHAAQGETPSPWLNASTPSTLAAVSGPRPSPDG